MASVYKRGRKHWIKFSRPGSSVPCRESLGCISPALAELIRRRLELELELSAPELRGIELPARLREIVGAPLLAEQGDPSPSALQVVQEYVAYIHAENAAHHRRNKITHLARFFGSKAVAYEEEKGNAEPVVAIPSKRKRAADPGLFKGRLFSEVSAAEVQGMIDSLEAGKKTKRHYRNTFHALFEFALKRNHFVPTNFRYPNPMSALPTYHEKNRKIIFLSQEQIEEALRALAPSPSVRVAAALMIYGGLRRAEALWLTRKDISADLRFFSVVNKTDEENDMESSLKTGERSVPILPPLRAILEDCLASPGSQWLCPSPEGHQWDGDNFAKRHRQLLKAAGVSHTCLHYRHTFATQRATEGWSLFKIAKRMGNSVAVCERYYAAFVDPSMS